MVASAFLAATIVFLAAGFWLLGECSFLIPFRGLLVEKYGRAIACYALVLFANLFAAAYLASRALFLKDTGRKLAHLDKQLRTGESLSDELARRLRE